MSNTIKKAIYAGSFDPLTLGHLWVIKKGAELFDELVVAIGENPSKKYMFSVKQRKKHIEEALKNHRLYKKIRIEVINNKFLVKYAEESKIGYLVRGIRSNKDFDYELMMNQVNREIAPRVETVYLIPPNDLAQVSSSMAKGLVGPEGWEKAIQKYVPESVRADLKKALKA
ncbi:MAG: pantetheine-phosphate adenylyltransferase [Bdellovibrionales bacterium]|nr:pantetheine-phosphate adenylyltransferase [Bdellovibrionales bacterium]